jgi:hypothetical protein
MEGKNMAGVTAENLTISKSLLVEIIDELEHLYDELGVLDEHRSLYKKLNRVYGISDTCATTVVRGEK